MVAELVYALVSKTNGRKSVWVRVPPKAPKMGYILEQKILVDVINSQKSGGSKIVFTHGAFDLFHVGHLEFIKKSLKYGDILIVGVDSDARIAKYKNPYRPVIKHSERMNILAHLNCVDFVLPLVGECTNSEFIKLYKKLSIDILTYGSKFGAPQAELVQRSNIVGFELKQIHHKYENLTVSTTSIIGSILKTGDVLLN